MGHTIDASSWTQQLAGIKYRGDSPTSFIPFPVIQSNMQTMQYWDGLPRFLNRLLDSGDFRGNPFDEDEMNYYDLIDGGYYVLATGTWVSMPPALDEDPEILIGFPWRASRHAGSGPYFQTTWVIDWEGTATVTVGLIPGGQITQVNANRIEVVYTENDADLAGISIRSCDNAYNFRIYRLTDEAALNSGEIFCQEFLDYYSPYHQLRTMDWQKSNNSKIRQLSDIPTLDSTAYLHSAPIEMIFELYKAMDVEIWMHVPIMMGAPAFPVDWQTMDAAAWYTWGNTNAASIIAETTNTQEYMEKIVTEMIAANYPTSKMFYLEPGNEIWNYGAGFSHASQYMAGIGEYLLSGQFERYGYGYMLGKFAYMFQQALNTVNGGSQSAQQWRMVVGCQTANSGRFTASMNGFAQYLTDSENVVPYSRLITAVTNYWGGGFRFVADAELFGPLDGEGEAWTETTWTAEWIDRCLNNPEALKTTILDYYYDDARGENFEQVLEWMDTIKSLAEGLGANYGLQYEGSSHDDMRGELLAAASTDDATGLAIRTFFYDFMDSDEHGDAMEFWIKRMWVKYPGQCISNFCQWGTRDPERTEVIGPWVSANWYSGQVTPTRMSSKYHEIWHDILDLIAANQA